MTPKQENSLLRRRLGAEKKNQVNMLAILDFTIAAQAYYILAVYMPILYTQK